MIFLHVKLSECMRLGPALQVDHNLVSAFGAAEMSCVHFKIVDTMGMDALILCPGLPQRAVLAGALALLQHAQLAADPDQPGGQGMKQPGALRHPTPLDQYMICQDIAAAARRGSNGMVHGRHQVVPVFPGAVGQSQNVIPQGPLQETFWQHPDELVYTHVQIQRIQALLQGFKQAGFTGTGCAIKEDNHTRSFHENISGMWISASVS